MTLPSYRHKTVELFPQQDDVLNLCSVLDKHHVTMAVPWSIFSLVACCIFLGRGRAPFVPLMR